MRVRCQSRKGQSLLLAGRLRHQRRHGPWSRLWFTETSSKTGQGVELAIARAVRAMLQTAGHPYYLKQQHKSKIEPPN